MDSKDLREMKITLENDLNRETIRGLLKVIREMTDNVFDRMDNNKILEITGQSMEIVKDYYKTIIDAINDLKDEETNK